MATIDDFKIPPEIIAEMKAMLKAAPDDAILSYIEATPKLAKGFRPGSRKSIAPIRTRLIRSLDSDRELDTLLLGIMGIGSQSASLVSRLSDLAIFEVRDALVTVYGRTPVLAALLVDYREEVRSMAIEILEENLAIAELDEDEARDELASVVVPILSALADQDVLADEPDIAEHAPSTPPATTSAELQELRQRVQELEGQLKKQSTGAKREKNLRKKVDALNKQKQKVEKELREQAKLTAKEESLNSDLKTQLQHAHENARQLEETLAARIEQGVEERLASIRNHWLAQPLALEEAATALRATAGADELLAGVEKLLAKQADVDRHSGNRAVVNEQIARLIDARDRVTTAQANALHPLPELSGAATRLGDEIARLQVLMGSPAAGDSDFVARMRARINAAKSEDELVELQAFLDQLNEREALSPSELQELYRCCHNRLSIVYAAFTPNVVRKKRRTRDPVWRLINEVEENHELLLLLDGHNVIHLLAGLFGSTYEDGIPGAATREKLIQLTIATVKDASNCQAHVYFDAPRPGREQRAPNVWEIYSGGGDAEHRADRAITDYLEYCCKTMSAMPRLLVTDDRELRAAAVKLGAKFMPVPQFGAFLEEMNS